MPHKRGLAQKKRCKEMSIENETLIRCRRLASIVQQFNEAFKIVEARAKELESLGIDANKITCMINDKRSISSRVTTTIKNKLHRDFMSSVDKIKIEITEQ